MKKRLIELTLKYADHEMAPGELSELRKLVEDNPDDARVCALLLDQEVALRGSRDNLDCRAPVMERIHDVVEKRTKQKTMQRVHALADHAGARRESRRFLLPLAIAAGIAVAVVGTWWKAGEKGQGARGKGQGVARIEAASGQWTVASGQWPVASGKGQVARAGRGPEVEASPHYRAGVGDEILAGDEITVGKDGRVSLAYGVGAKVELGASSILRMPPARPIGPIRPICPMARLETGRLTATVREQEAGRPFVVETPQARVEVLGTRFSLAVEENSTRLEVIEGLVRFLRLSDGERIDVRAGWYAVAAAGVELMAMALPGTPKGEYPEPRTHLYGRILFEDHFDQGLGKWEIFTNDHDGTVAVGPETERLVKTRHSAVYTARDDLRQTWGDDCAVLDTGSAELKDISLCIRSRQEIHAERFVIEARCYVAKLDPKYGLRAGSILEIGGIEMSGGTIILDLSKRVGLGEHLFRWEFFPAKDLPGDMLLCHFFDRDGRRFNRSLYVRPASRRILLGAENMLLAVDSVVAREMREESESE